MKYLDAFLNRITMYRLVAYGLGILTGASFLLAADGRLALNPFNMAVSLSVLLVSTYLVNRIFAGIWRLPANSESWLITALILFFLLPPATHAAGFWGAAAAGALASASKFILAWRGKHVFNPAALAAAAVNFSSLDPASWWVGTSALFPLSVLLGFLVVRKIQRFSMVVVFGAVALTVQFILLQMQGLPLDVGMKHAITASPLVFLGTIMLTEPATMPPRRGQQLIFAALVAVLYVTAWQLGPFVIYPEVALLLGNVYAYLVSPKYRLRLQLREVQKISDRVYNYVFAPDRKFSFLPGQYMEWTLEHVPFDHRGNRRTFTIASSPTESMVQVGLKYYEPTSTFKYAFSRLQPGDTVYAGQLAGNFTLTGNEHKKLAFIAGGIGITPFRSMAKYLTDTGTHVDAVLLYSVSDPSELAYLADLQAAAAVGLKTMALCAEADTAYPNVAARRLDADLLANAVPDYAERLFYVSGPETMVHAAKGYLRELGVSPLNIKTDRFTGY